MDLEKINKELYYVGHPEMINNTKILIKVIKEMNTEIEQLKAINYSQCCTTLKDLKGNEIQIKSLSDLKKKYPKGTTFSVAEKGKELNYYVNGQIVYTRTL